MSLQSILPITLGLAVATCGIAPPGEPVPVAAEIIQEDAQNEFDHTHALWTTVLEKHVHGDRFDYAALQKDPKSLNDYIAVLQSVTTLFERANRKNPSGDSRIRSIAIVLAFSAASALHSMSPSTTKPAITRSRWLKAPFVSRLVPVSRTKALALSGVGRNEPVYG